MTRAIPAACLLAALSAQASAIGTATWEWQVSLDDGSSWNDGVVLVPREQNHVRARLLVGWQGDGAGYAYAGVSTDPTITGLSGAGPADRVLDPARPWPMNIGSLQALTATRFANVLKIDDARDSYPPGAGSRGVSPAQLVEQYAGTNFTTANPVSIIEYTLELDGTLGTRHLSDAPVTTVFGTWGMRIYTSREGAQNYIPGRTEDWYSAITRTETDLIVIPAPSALVLPMLVPLAKRRRRTW